MFVGLRGGWFVGRKCLSSDYSTNQLANYQTTKRTFYLLILFLVPAFSCTLSPSPTTNPFSTPANTPTPSSLPLAGTPLPRAQQPAIDPQPFAFLDIPPVINRQCQQPYDFSFENLANPTLLDQLNENQQALLNEQGFVAIPVTWASFADLYQRAQTNGVPQFVSADAVINTTLTLLHATQQQTEDIYITADLNALNRAMVAQAEAQLTAASSATIEAAAFRNLAFFSVGGRLLDPDFPVPVVVSTLVAEELTLIADASTAGIFISPLTGNPYDYTPFHDQTSYQQARLWFNRPLFDPHVSVANQRQQATQLLLLLSSLETTENFSRWDRVAVTTAYFGATADQLTMWQVQAIVADLYGDPLTAVNIAAPQRLDDFVATLLTLAEQEVVWIRDDVRMDAGIFQTLSFNQTTTYQGDPTLTPFTVSNTNIGQVRGLPHPLDLAIAYGSTHAQKLLAETGDIDFDGYSTQSSQWQRTIAAKSPITHTFTLEQGWLYALQPLLPPIPNRYPEFTQSEAWQDKQLATWFGGWANNRVASRWEPAPVANDNEVVPAIPTEQPLAFLEPLPDLYARLYMLTHLTRTGLAQRGILDETTAQKLAEWERFLLDLKQIAEREIAGNNVTTSDLLLLTNFGAIIRDLTTFAGRQPAPLSFVATIATDPTNGQLLQVGVGEAWQLFTIVPINGDPTLTVGGIYVGYQAKRLPNNVTLPFTEADGVGWQSRFIIP